MLHEILIKRKIQIHHIAEGLASLGFSDSLASFPKELKAVFVAVRKDGEAAKGGDRGENNFGKKQRDDLELFEIFTYLESGVLTQDPARARELTDQI